MLRCVLPLQHPPTCCTEVSCYAFLSLTKNDFYQTRTILNAAGCSVPHTCAYFVSYNIIRARFPVRLTPPPPTHSPPDSS